LFTGEGAVPFRSSQQQASSCLKDSQHLALVPAAKSLSHSEACHIAHLALRERRAHTVIVDLKNVFDATTSAFARLVLLRRRLLQAGRDLRLVNLHDRTASVYQINRLAGVLPCV
jgi:anti-anti-sigma regulatory factor